jgi:hypothetical protein
MFYRWLAIAVIGLHFGYLAYLVVGGFLAWRWPLSFVPHVIAVAWGVLIIAGTASCPLTWLQNTLRERGGQRRLDMSFIDTYVRGVLFPADHEIAARALVALIVAVAWLGLLLMWVTPPSGPHIKRGGERVRAESGHRCQPGSKEQG